ncbi:MAG: preprotein translocase subunit YajC [Candidatus Cloacimonetes bacterium]|nr:preprotein translocase subunit YajC [Candidatus Cloacimonadota bacterium]
MLLLLGFFIFLMVTTIMTGRREKKHRAELLSSLAKHDRVQTAGGMIGTIVEIKGDEVVLKVDETTNTKIRFSRGSVTAILKKGRGADQLPGAGNSRFCELMPTSSADTLKPISMIHHRNAGGDLTSDTRRATRRPFMQNLIRNTILTVALLTLCALAIYPPAEKLRLGKDLAGGVSLTYNILPVEGRDLILAGAMISIALNPLTFHYARKAYEYAGRTARNGWDFVDNLPIEERKWIAQNLTAPLDKYREEFMLTMQRMGGDHFSEGYLENYYQAQCMKDDTMAESIVMAMAYHKKSRVIHFNGVFHSQEFLGTVSRVRKALPKARIAVITPIAMMIGKALFPMNRLKHWAPISF